MTTRRKGPATKRARSGPSLTAAQRRENGLSLLAGIWLPAELVSALDGECERTGQPRTAVLKQALTSYLSRG